MKPVFPGPIILLLCQPIAKSALPSGSRWRLHRQACCSRMPCSRPWFGGFIAWLAQMLPLHPLTSSLPLGVHQRGKLSWVSPQLFLVLLKPHAGVCSCSHLASSASRSPCHRSDGPGTPAACRPHTCVSADAIVSLHCTPAITQKQKAPRPECTRMHQGHVLYKKGQKASKETAQVQLSESPLGDTPERSCLV